MCVTLLKGLSLKKTCKTSHMITILLVHVSTTLYIDGAIHMVSFWQIKAANIWETRLVTRCHFVSAAHLTGKLMPSVHDAVLTGLDAATGYGQCVHSGPSKLPRLPPCWVQLCLLYFFISLLCSTNPLFISFPCQPMIHKHAMLHLWLSFLH